MDEERLAQEVLYLHSLWYIGPPNHNSNPNPYPNFAHNSIPYPNVAPSSTTYPNSAPNSTPHQNFHPNSTYNCHLSYPNPNPRPHFNPISRSDHHLSFPNPNPRPHYNPTSNNSSQLHNRQPKKQRTDPSEEKEWPCDPTSVPDQSAPDTWPALAPPKPAAPPLSPDSSSRSALLSLQFPAIQSCKSFFTNPDSESDPDPDSDSESEIDSDTDSFFKGLFEKDVGLRVCYEKDHDKGEFYCLVCESQKEGKKGKGVRYKGCVALTQHASTVIKAGSTRVHRAFARAVCGVLGWDETRLPSIVLLPGSVLKINKTKDITKETDSNPNPNSPTKEITKKTDSNPNPNSPELPKDADSNPNPNSLTKEPTKETDSTNPNPNSPLKEPTKETNSNPNPSSNNNTEWPSCPTPFPNPNPPATWAATLAAAPPPPGTTAQSEALARASHIQRKAIKSTKRFLSLLEEEYSGSDSDPDLQPGSDNQVKVKVKVNSTEVDFDFEEEGEERPDMEQFFTNIFEKDPRLREYYGKNKEKGDFYCFVCQVRRDFKRKGMRYKSGLALTQHANTVSKEGGRGAHRALARVLCRVFGWDPLSLPGPVKEVEEGSERDEKVGEKSDGNSNDNVKFLNSSLEEKEGPSISA